MTSRDLLLVLATLVSVGALKWCGRTIVEALAERKRAKVLPCQCGRFVVFPPPLQLPTKADLYAFGGQVLAGMAVAEGVPMTTAPGQLVLEDLVAGPGGDLQRPPTDGIRCASCGCHGHGPPVPDAELVEVEDLVELDQRT